KVFPNDPTADANDLTVYMYLQGSAVFTPGSETGLLGLVFDPDFENNGALYVNYTYVDQSACTYLATRVERIVVPDPTANFVSVPEMVRTPLVEFCQPNVNHNGGMLAFGPDGMLYVSTGDGGGGSGTAYDLSTPLGSILRIDPTDGSAPPDNPFVGVTGADPRIYHLGLRNPWRFSFDRAPPHDLWIGDVGQDDWEEIDRVPFSPGGVDFGWPACEGTHDYNGTCGARGDVGPVIELPHIDAYSITGGYVYRGPGLPELTGLYVFGDFGTGRIWAWDGVTLDPSTGEAALIDLASVNNASSFGEDDAGELYVIDYATGRIRRFAPGSGGGGFPTLLSQTGLFADTAALTPAPGLVEYDVRSPLWSDRALKRRWLALPAGSQVDPTLEDAWSFPIGTVFVKHFELPVAPGQTRRLETRLFIHQLVGWTGVTYRWNEAETDATLLTTALADVIPVVENGQSFDQTWQYPSPAGCLACHTVASGRVLGVRTAQLNRTFPYPAGDDEQLNAWSCSGILSESYGGQPGLAAHAALDDTTASLQRRARAYFDSNCSMCHQPGGTAPGGIDMRSRVLLGDMHLIGVAPNQGDLGLPSPERIKPGVSAESVLYARMAASDPAVRMASGTLLAHDAALSVVGSWIDTGLSIIDTDEDGVADATDLCPGVPDPGQADRDGDLLGDACDPDDAPDLVAVASGPAQAGAGQVVSVSGTVDNGGLRTAMSSQVRLYLSLDTAFD
ncbi:MAG TPA: hypothetical protein ENO23_04790, partial [Alphaproteobacteria bacterium]|nr:hypothetical protein [Alphaproteobacteria bacterium]